MTGHDDVNQAAHQKDCPLTLSPSATSRHVTLHHDHLSPPAYLAGAIRMSGRAQPIRTTNLSTISDPEARFMFVMSPTLPLFRAPACPVTRYKLPLWLHTRFYPCPRPGLKHPQDTEIQAIFYTVLYAGMCLTAVNLPSIWLLLSKASSPEKALHSVRSCISLRSLESHLPTAKDRYSGSLSSKDSRVVNQARQPSRERTTYSIGKFNPEVCGYEAPIQRDRGEDPESGRSGGSLVPPVPPVGNIVVRETVMQTTAER